MAKKKKPIYRPKKADKKPEEVGIELFEAKSKMIGIDNTLVLKVSPKVMSEVAQQVSQQIYEGITLSLDNICDYIIGVTNRILNVELWNGNSSGISKCKIPSIMQGAEIIFNRPYRVVKIRVKGKDLYFNVKDDCVELYKGIDTSEDDVNRAYIAVYGVLCCYLAALVGSPGIVRHTQIVNTIYEITGEIEDEFIVDYYGDKRVLSSVCIDDMFHTEPSNSVEELYNMLKDAVEEARSNG